MAAGQGGGRRNLLGRHAPAKKHRMYHPMCKLYASACVQASLTHANWHIASPPSAARDENCGNIRENVIK